MYALFTNTFILNSIFWQSTTNGALWIRVPCLISHTNYIAVTNQSRVQLLSKFRPVFWTQSRTPSSNASFLKCLLKNLTSLDKYQLNSSSVSYCTFPIICKTDLFAWWYVPVPFYGEQNHLPLQSLITITLC